MNREQRSAILTALIRSLDANGSWCGETHIQKATYHLQKLFNLDLGEPFILYKHGPYSFELTEELALLRSDKVLKLVPMPFPYGPKIVLGELGEKTIRENRAIVDRFTPAIEFVGKRLADKKVADLEKLATALYVTLEFLSSESEAKRAKKIHELKPHVTIQEAKDAVSEIEQIRKEARSLQVSTS